MIKISQDDLLKEPETIRLTPLGKLTTIFDLIVSDSTSKVGQAGVVIYNELRYQIERVDWNTLMPNDYVRLYCHHIKEIDKQHKPVGNLLFM